MSKPYIRISHIITEVTGFAFVVAAIIYSIIKSSTFDGEIPTHYNLAGEIDGYGSPYVSLILPIIMLAMLLLLSLVNHLVPSSAWSIPFTVNPDRAVQVFSDLTMMIAIMELLTGVYTLFETALFLDQEHSTLGITFVYVALLFTDIMVQCIRAKKHNLA